MNYSAIMPRPFCGFVDCNEGVSPSYQEVRNKYAEIQQDNSRTITFGMKNLLLPMLLDIKKSCREERWDGYDSSPVEEQTISAALLLINSLPSDIIEPEITPEPSGAISFDWQTEDGLCFAVSVEQNEIYYAGLLGKEKIHGEISSFNTIPEKILSILLNNFTK